MTSVKVLGAGLGGKAAGFLRGLGWAVSQGFDVINLSLGTNRREWALAFHEVCDEAYFRNCTWPRTHSGSIGTLTRRRSFWPAGSTSTCRGPPGPVTPAPPG